MLDAASSLGYRLIVPNRRLYPGSTPYTQEEIDALQPSAAIEIFVSTLERQGKYLLEFCDNMIREHALKKVAISGWSLGSLFLMVAVSAIRHVTEAAASRLKENIKAIISLDPATMMHGLDHPVPAGGWAVPLFDQKLTPEERVKEFVIWVTGYFPHPNLESKDFGKLHYESVPNPKRARTFRNTSPEEFISMVDPSAADKGESSVGDKVFWPTTRRMTEDAFFNQEMREIWGNMPFAVIYGSETTSTVVWCAWQMEDMAQRAGVELTAKIIPGGNHFPMVDDIPLLFEAINSCIRT